MTPSNAAPLAHGTTPVQGWANASQHRHFVEQRLWALPIYNERMEQVRDLPIALTVLALDASGQRVVPEELVQNCLAELERRGAVMSPDRAECERDIRDVLSAALLSASSLGLPK